MARKVLDETRLPDLWSIMKDNFNEKLISGENIKTINGEPVLGKGDIEISSVGKSGEGQNSNIFNDTATNIAKGKNSFIAGINNTDTGEVISGGEAITQTIYTFGVASNDMSKIIDNAPSNQGIVINIPTPENFETFKGTLIGLGCNLDYINIISASTEEQISTLINYKNIKKITLPGTIYANNELFGNGKEIINSDGNSTYDVLSYDFYDNTSNSGYFSILFSTKQTIEKYEAEIADVYQLRFDLASETSGSTKNITLDNVTVLGKNNKVEENAIFILGNGDADGTKKNTLLVTEDNNMYLNGIGGYDGTNPTKAMPLQEEVKKKNYVIDFGLLQKACQDSNLEGIDVAIGGIERLIEAITNGNTIEFSYKTGTGNSIGYHNFNCESAGIQSEDGKSGIILLALKNSETSYIDFMLSYNESTITSGETSEREAFTLKTLNSQDLMGEGNIKTTYEIKEISGTTINMGLEANVYYKFNTVTSLTLTLINETKPYLVSMFTFEFTSGSTPTTLKLPSNIKWFNGEPLVIEANKTYQISICNNLAVGGAFYAAN